MKLIRLIVRTLPRKMAVFQHNKWNNTVLLLKYMKIIQITPSIKEPGIIDRVIIKFLIVFYFSNI